MANVYFDRYEDEATRRTRLYAGDLYVFSSTHASLKLCELAEVMCREAFSPHHPSSAQDDLPVEQYVEILKSLKPAFIHHPDCKRFIPQMLEELGCDLASTYFDVPRLRTACSGDYLTTGMAYAFKPHRDTWYSTPMCQLNWWLPVFPIDATNAMAFHPMYWNRPILNSSAKFNYRDWNQTGRRQAASQSTKSDNRFQSAALEPIQLEPDLRLVCPPGGVIVFSAAHLHSTVANTSGLTRFSIDFRTVDARDVATQRGAPNIDSESTGTTMMDYLRGTDLEHFSDEIIDRYAQLYPDPRVPTPSDIIERALAAST